jgi:outer membrane protein assembly factor BamB
MKTIYRILLVLVLLPALLHAEELFKGATVVPMAFPPGERNIVRLVSSPDGAIIIGVIRSGDGTPCFFSINAGQLKEEHPPFAFSKELNELVANPDAPLLIDLPTLSHFALSTSGKLLKIDVAARISEVGQLAGTRPYEKEGYQISRAIVKGPDGAVYTAGDKGAIFKYDPAANKLEKLNAVLPAMKGREPWASLDAAVFGPDGLLYGGTFDGYLFTFDPKTLQVVNLGKPLRQQRIRGLAFRNGKLIGIGGEDDGMPRSFAFDPQTRGFELGGAIPDPAGNNPILEPIGAFLGLPDGTVYFSTTGRLANLYMWKPEPAK